MNIDMAHLERVNYKAIMPVVEVTPGIDLILRDDVILASSDIFPAPDTTHACLVQTSPDTVDNLITEVIEYYGAKDLPVTFFVSPVCTPADLSARLEARGFVKNEGDEAWVVLEDLSKINFLARRSEVSVELVESEEVSLFAKTFLAAFEQPVEYASILAQLFRPSIGLPSVSHYLAREEGFPVGTISLTKYENYGIIGSAGIIPEHRKTKVIVELFGAIYDEAQRVGIDTLFAQTRVGSTAEQLLLANHFARVFVRQGYTLSE